MGIFFFFPLSCLIALQHGSQSQIIFSVTFHRGIRQPQPLRKRDRCHRDPAGATPHWDPYRSFGRSCECSTEKSCSGRLPFSFSYASNYAGESKLFISFFLSNLCVCWLHVEGSQTLRYRYTGYLYIYMATIVNPHCEANRHNRLIAVSAVVPLLGVWSVARKVSCQSGARRGS